MQKSFQQPILKILFWLGCIIVPCMLVLSYIIFNIDDAYNYSGLMELHPILFRIFAMIVLVDYVGSCYILSTESVIGHKDVLFISLVILLLLSIFFPYHSKESLSASMHLIFSYSAFVIFNIILYFFVLNERDKQIYTLILVFCFMQSMASMQITGFAQTVYFASLSILLAIKIKRIIS